jgi:hypothetical protein
MNSINGQKINQYGSLGIQEGNNVSDGRGMVLAFFFGDVM